LGGAVGEGDGIGWVRGNSDESLGDRGDGAIGAWTAWCVVWIFSGYS
jgi:hypothetical protein